MVVAEHEQAEDRQVPGHPVEQLTSMLGRTISEKVEWALIGLEVWQPVLEDVPGLTQMQNMKWYRCQQGYAKSFGVGRLDILHIGAIQILMVDLITNGQEESSVG